MKGTVLEMAQGVATAPFVFAKATSAFRKASVQPPRLLMWVNVAVKTKKSIEAWKRKTLSLASITAVKTSPLSRSVKAADTCRAEKHSIKRVREDSGEEKSVWSIAAKRRRIEEDLFEEHLKSEDIDEADVSDGDFEASPASPINDSRLCGRSVSLDNHSLVRSPISMAADISPLPVATDACDADSEIQPLLEERSSVMSVETSTEILSLPHLKSSITISAKQIRRVQSHSVSRSPWRLIVESMINETFMRHSNVITACPSKRKVVPPAIRQLVERQYSHYISQCQFNAENSHFRSYKRKHNHAGSSTPSYLDADDLNETGCWIDDDADGIPDPDYFVHCNTCSNDSKMDQCDLWGSDGPPFLQGLPRNPPSLRDRVSPVLVSSLGATEMPGTPGKRWEYPVYGGRFQIGVPCAYWEM